MSVSLFGRKFLFHFCNFDSFHGLFKSISTSIIMSGDSVLAGLDETQAALMKEECLLVDHSDNVIGSASKKECHLLKNINKGMLHRAFSVFLFNSDGKLLLQQRADEKITFPAHWTNTCCSHPLKRPGEDDEADAIGVKRAAQRKLEHELGIRPEQVPLSCFQYLTRLLYRADNVPADGTWAEHEIDYVLLCQRDVVLNVNPNEVQAIKYVTQDELRDLLKTANDTGTLVTPWFSLICERWLFPWWNDLASLQQHEDHQTVHNLVA